MFDYQFPGVQGAANAYPDSVVTDVPTQSDEIKETMVVGGTSTGGSINVTGTADQFE